MTETLTFPAPPIDPRFDRPIKEMVCLYGDSGVGKTYMALTVALWHQNLGSDRHFYIISSDLSYGPVLMGGEFADLMNVTVREVSDLDEYIKAARQSKAQARPGDWIFADRIDHAWGWAQDEFAAAQARQAGSTIEDMGDLWKAAGTDGDYPIQGWDWGMPNGRYRALRGLLVSSRAHLMVMADEKDLLKESRSGKTEEQQMFKNTFRHIGCRPTGQKEDSSTWHTIIHVEAPDTRRQSVATAKERFSNRPWLGQKMANGSYRHVPMEDFFMDYFVEVAKWQMK